LGHVASLDYVLNQLEADYGSLESRESIMRQFYSCQQGSDETVLRYATRLEEVFDKAVNLHALRRSDRGILKDVFYSGLLKDLKHLTVYQHDRLTSYDDLKREVRRIEADIKGKASPEEKATCKPAVRVESGACNAEMTEMKSLLQKLNYRMEALEKQQQQPSQFFRLSSRREQRRHGTFQPRGRGDYRPLRPTASRTFTPTCYFCNQRGHMQRDCPAQQSQVVCFRCNEHRHFARNCPKV